MPLVFDKEGFPTCCGRILPAARPITYCPLCYMRYSTAEIIAEHNRRKDEWKEYKPEENSNEIH